MPIYFFFLPVTQTPCFCFQREIPIFRQQRQLDLIEQAYYNSEWQDFPLFPFLVSCVLLLILFSMLTLVRAFETNKPFDAKWSQNT